MGAHRNRQRNNKPRGQGVDYRCECGQPSTVLMWCIQLNADDRTHKNFVPLCADCLALERQYNGEPACLTLAPTLQIVNERGAIQNQALTWLAQHGPASSRRLADALRITYSSAWNTIQRLARDGQIRCVDEVRQHNGKLTKIWSVG